MRIPQRHLMRSITVEVVVTRDPRVWLGFLFVRLGTWLAGMAYSQVGR